MEHPQEIFMKNAIKEAKSALARGDYPLGAVVVMDNKIIATAQTTLIETNDPSAHAEMNAIRKAAKIMKSRYLEGAWLYSTQEPCPMCAGVAVWAKMAGIVFGATKKETSAIRKPGSKTIFDCKSF